MWALGWAALARISSTVSKPNSAAKYFCRFMVSPLFNQYIKISQRQNEAGHCYHYGKNCV
jgi:hypothetical protein